MIVLLFSQSVEANWFSDFKEFGNAILHDWRHHREQKEYFKKNNINPSEHRREQVQHWIFGEIQYFNFENRLYKIPEYMRKIENLIINHDVKSPKSIQEVIEHIGKHKKEVNKEKQEEYDGFIDQLEIMKRNFEKQMAREREEEREKDNLDASIFWIGALAILTKGASLTVYH